MFRHTAVHVQRKIVRKDPQTMSIVPLLLGPDTHPLTSAATLLRVALFTVEPGRTSLPDMLWEFNMVDALETAGCSYCIGGEANILNTGRRDLILSLKHLAENAVELCIATMEAGVS